MKKFRCGDVVPGCTARFTGNEDEILAAVTRHAREDHGMAAVGDDLVEAVRSHLVAA